MIVQSRRFGQMEVDEGDILQFPTGIIGFPVESAFVLIRRSGTSAIGWLQSVRTAEFTLPVVSAHALSRRFPDVDVAPHAERAGLGTDVEDLAILAVLTAPPNAPASVNLMAPIIVNAKTRVGAQVMLEGTHFSTREPFVLARGSTDSDDGAQPDASTGSEP